MVGAVRIIRVKRQENSVVFAHFRYEIFHIDGDFRPGVGHKAIIITDVVKETETHFRAVSRVCVQPYFHQIVFFIGFEFELRRKVNIVPYSFRRGEAHVISRVCRRRIARFDFHGTRRAGLDLRKRGKDCRIEDRAFRDLFVYREISRYRLAVAAFIRCTHFDAVISRLLGRKGIRSLAFRKIFHFGFRIAVHEIHFHRLFHYLAGKIAHFDPRKGIRRSDFTRRRF